MTTQQIEASLATVREGYLSKVNFGGPPNKTFKLAYYQSREQDLRAAAGGLGLLFDSSDPMIRILLIGNNQFTVTISAGNSLVVVREVLIHPVCFQELLRENGNEVQLAFLYYDGAVPNDIVTSFEPQQTILVQGAFVLNLETEQAGS